MRKHLGRLGPHRNQIAVLVTVVVAMLALVTARADGLVGGAVLGDTATSPSPAPSQSASASSAGNSGTPAGGGGAKNIVQVFNHTDGRLVARGNVQIDPVPAADVQPANLALAYGNCNQCDTFAVALQINLVGPNVTTYMPQNAASAVNYECNGCVTVAIAYQYNIQVSDPTQVPPRVAQLRGAMEQEVHTLSTGPGVTPQQAEAQISAVLAQFQDLAGYLIVQRQESEAQTDPGATPAPDQAASPSPSATASPSPTSGSSASPSPSATPATSPSP